MDLRSVSPPPPRSVPASILAEAKTLVGALEELAAHHGGEECLRILEGGGRERRARFDQIWSDALRANSALRERGVGGGRVVIIALHTGLDLVAAYFGALLAGAVPALVAPPSNRHADLGRYRERLAGILANAEPAAVFCSEEIAAALADEPSIVAHGTSLLGAGDLPARESLEIAHPDPEDVATVQYSSGSTGEPKGVLLTHRAILANLRGFAERLELGAEDVGVSWAPLYHDMGLIDTFLLPILRGYPAVLIPTLEFMRDPSLWLWGLHHYRGTVTFAPNFAYSLCAKRIREDALAGLDLSALRLAVSSAEPILAETCLSFTRRFAPYGFRSRAFTGAYGMAENVTAATMDGPRDELVIDTVDRDALAGELVANPAPGRGGVALVGSGPAIPGTEIEIRDEKGRPLEDRRVGTIWFRGDSLFSGYRHDRVRTDDVVRDGWFRSSDRGYLVEGRLFFVSRETDLIVIGGEKYMPHDIESSVNAVPGVREGCAVAFGVLNEERGTEDLAVVAETKEADAQALEELRRSIRARVMQDVGLGLRYLLLVEPGGVEKTTSGKLARDATRRRYSSELAP